MNYYLPNFYVFIMGLLAIKLSYPPYLFYLINKLCLFFILLLFESLKANPYY